MKAAFVFPGQGSQSVGMMGSFEKLPAVRQTFEEASGYLGIDLWKLVQEGPAEKLNETVNTQPVMLVAGVAMYRAWQASSDLRPVSMAGHSLGEYSALVASGILKFADAVPLVRFRAQAMQDAVPAGVGAIAAIIGLDDDAIRAVCREASAGAEQVEAANFNSPAQVVIAGHKVAVERGMELAKTKGAKRAMLLPMSVPSHCALMRPAAMQLKNRLAQIALHVGSIPVLHNADVAAAATEDKVKDALVRQLYQPVRWVETVRTLVAAGATHIVECGPGKVLAGVNKRIVPDAKILTFGDATNFEEALASFKGDRIES
ncbi:MAG: ACP S-malonyltransferase [Burkholderiales bacterium]